MRLPSAARSGDKIEKSGGLGMYPASPSTLPLCIYHTYMDGPILMQIYRTRQHYRNIHLVLLALLNAVKSIKIISYTYTTFTKRAAACIGQCAHSSSINVLYLQEYISHDVYYAVRPQLAFIYISAVCVLSPFFIFYTCLKINFEESLIIYIKAFILNFIFIYFLNSVLLFYYVYAMDVF